MSYDVDVATHERPAPPDPPAGVTVDGPLDVEPTDLAEALAAAVLAPRWLAWLAARPFFGGHAHPPGDLGLDVDWRVLRDDARWREAVVDLFAAVAAATSALEGEAFAERHRNVSATNRLSIDGKWVGREHRGPAWLEWDGALTRHGELARERHPLFPRRA